MRPRLLPLLLIPLLALPVFYASSQAVRSAPEFDLLIKNGKIVDGTGNPWFVSDLAVKDGRIAEMGIIAVDRAVKVIDAGGLMVAPGFIDVHAHIESSIAPRPTADNYLQMGVTSVITGNCGGSALSLGEWFSRVEKDGASINIGSLIGHNTVRRAAMNGDFNRAPSAEELDRMRQLVEQAMKDGAVGMSTGLIYIPGTWAKTDEIVELARVSAKFGGVYASHMRDEGEFVDKSVSEALEIGARSGCPVEISHFKVASKKRWGDSALVTKMVAEARARGQQVTVDQYMYTASSTNIGTLLPDWVFDGGFEKVRERLSNPATRSRIRAEMIASQQRKGRTDFSYAYVASHRANPAFNGKNLPEIARMVRGQAGAEEEAEQAMEIVLAGGAQMIYHTMSEQDVEQIFRQPFTMVAADAGVEDTNPASVPHPRGFGNNVRALGKYVREQKLVSLEDGIRKMTSLPAQTFRLMDRGLLRKGMMADMVIFDDRIIADRATFQQPKQYASGIDYVIVNGQIAIEKGKHSGIRAGRILRIERKP